MPNASCEINAYGDEEEIWKYLVELSPNEEIAAGIMGWFYRESRLKADAVAGWPERSDGFCEVFADEVDDGLDDRSTMDWFVERVRWYGGYGLGQWVAWGYLHDFYDYMAEHAESITDVKAQCEFAVWSLQQNEELWNELLECTTAIQCGRRIGLFYDGTSAEGAEAIAAFADYFHKEMNR